VSAALLEKMKLTNSASLLFSSSFGIHSKKVGGVDALLPNCFIGEFSAGCQPRHLRQMPFGAGIIKSPAWTTAVTARCQPRHPVKVSIGYGGLSCPISSTTFSGALSPEPLLVHHYYMQTIVNSQELL
jgi:hypothetical protein